MIEGTEALRFGQGGGFPEAHCAGAARGAAVEIGERPVRVGTARNCDVVVETDEKGGYVEARLWSYDGRVVLHAVGVRSRVVVNGQPVAWAVLEHGDRMELAGHEFRLRFS